MSALAAIARPRAERSSALERYRDDGLLADVLGRTLGAAIPVAPLALVVAGALPLLGVLALRAEGAPHALVGAAVAWLVLVGGASSGRPARGRLAWAVPPLLRLAEYGTLLWCATLAGSGAVPSAFALLAALAFRHYDIVYRLRYQGVAPPEWLRMLAGGWDGRLLVGWAFLATGALPGAFFVLAALLALVFTAESVAGWLRFTRAERPSLYADEEDEHQ